MTDKPSNADQDEYALHLSDEQIAEIRRRRTDKNARYVTSEEVRELFQAISDNSKKQ